MDQIEFLDAIRTKKISTAQIAFDCGCELLFLSVSGETYAKPCPIHQDVIES